MGVAKKGLGKGLGALIEADNSSNSIYSKSGVLQIDITKIEPNKSQPRKYFDEDSLTILADSLKEFGLIQPIIVKEEDGYYSIIAGERRFRAARLAKFDKIPAIIKDYNQVEILQVALIENIQRQDLNAIEEALCFKRLIDEYFFTQEEVASKIGKSRNSISNSLSLLSLDLSVQNFIIENKLTPAHGRSLLQIKDHDKLFDVIDTIIENNLSVKETDRLIKSIVNFTPMQDNFKHIQNKYKYLESDLKTILGTKVNIKHSKNGDKGKIEIEYYSDDELDRLLNTFKQIQPSKF
jgi:ParB family transcriptional regulator, chromosome partitioning protein